MTVHARHHYSWDQDAPITAAENFRLARAAYMRGALTGRDLYWFKLEERRMGLAHPVSAPIKAKFIRI